ncbi:nuclear transport factor 2 family protein [Streptomyces sp. TRM 70361]|uniref:nuclear transport factor 2 family protein n=1 Tax=Streptomyces sp. TRM 70361 TaxID=3116553 RepID=UPI002E7B34C7|nr:nuclear transport factor 2 family protein [Streptomyces sp. TRM 70361]MEE1940726.1 nuclear transport factor 2 family protein [Streptomyces sp. TRM 70361]
MTGDWSARAVIERYWSAAQARDWDAFGALLAPGVVYELPQTRERVRGREACVRFNAEYPGAWRVTVERVVAEERQAVSWTGFTVDGDTVPGLCFFTLDGDGLIDTVTDFWPEPYEPPAGRGHLVERY